MGEAKFFRAYCYFELLQLYGDAIITKTPLDVTDPEFHDNIKVDDENKILRELFKI